MADDTSLPRVEVSFEDMDSGYTSQKPSSLYQPGSPPIYRDMKNCFPESGMMRPGWAFRVFDDFPPSSIDNNTASFNVSQNTNAQYPVFLYSENAGMKQENTVRIVVTTREIFWQRGSTLRNLTPVYTTGTASCAGGTTVTGTGTAWVTNNIGSRGMITFDTGVTWHVIDAVTTNTALTLFANGPNTGGSVAYIIKRCFGGSNLTLPNYHIFCRVFNGDLYVGGNIVGGEDSAGTSVPAVVKCPNVLALTTTPADTDSQYQFSRLALDTTMSTNGAVIAEVSDILGMQIADDGRILLATHEYSSTTSRVARFRFSSHLSTRNWTVQPAGFVDLIGYDGAIYGLGKLGATLTAHFARGVMRGSPTGNQNQPYTWERTAAEVGSIYPESISDTNAGEAYVGSDGHAHLFNGASSQQISDDTFQEFFRYTETDTNNTGGNENPYFRCFGLYDLSNDYYHVGINTGHFFATDPNWDEDEIECHHLTIRPEDKALFRAQYEGPLTCFGNPNFLSFPNTGDDEALVASKVVYAGFNSFAPFIDANGAQTDLTLGFWMPLASALIWDQQSDIVPFQTEDEHYFTIGPQDFGAPGNLKTLIGVWVWAAVADMPAGEGYPLTVSVWADPVETNSVTYSKTLQVDDASSSNEDFRIAIVPFYFEPGEPPAGERFNVKITIDPASGARSLGGGVQKVRMVAAVGGKIQAVDYVTV